MFSMALFHPLGLRPMSHLNLRHTSIAAALLLALACAAPSIHAQTAPTPEPLVVKRATELRSAPGDSAPSLGPLAAQSTVTRLTARQGPWMEVRTAQGTAGWLHMFDVGSAPSAGGNVATGALRGITNFFNRSATPAGGSAGGMTSTVGIRGLGAEDLARSQPNLAAVAQAEGLRQNDAQARSFAADAKLTAQAVEALPAPAGAAR